MNIAVVTEKNLKRSVAMIGNKRASGHSHGRPSLFEPRFCDEIIGFCRMGYSPSAFAGHIGVSRECLSGWARQHDDFSQAIKVAKAAWALWYEDRAREIAFGGPGCARMITFALRNAAPEDYPDKQSVVHSSRNAEPIPEITPDATPQEASEIYARRCAQISSY